MGFYHSVAQGECLSSIARYYGFARWELIYDDPANADFRKLRTNPNVLSPGDRLFIPDRQVGLKDGSTDAEHQFRVTEPKIVVRLVVRDESWQPMQDKRYELVVDKVTYKGTTDSDGFLEHPKSGEQPIAPDTSEVVLRVFAGAGAAAAATPHVWNIRLGHLDPISEIRGVQARLRNLGLLHAPLSGKLDEPTESAVNAFRKRVGLDQKELDMLDDAARSELEKGHDTKTGLHARGAK